MSDENDLLADYVLGTLPAAERARVEAALQGSPALAEALEALEGAMQLVGVGLEAPKSAWVKVQQSLAGGRRFEHLVPRLAELFDVDVQAARALAAAVDDDAAWGE
ncbi:MAG: zf-HC2 domain-containing protein, partial [Myxococcaceae bacterium]|nr:zf-HC2 domain-containing protein [Myxococcaceae bacterium]